MRGLDARIGHRTDDLLGSRVDDLDDPHNVVGRPRAVDEHAVVIPPVTHRALPPSRSRSPELACERTGAEIMMPDDAISTFGLQELYIHWTHLLYPRVDMQHPQRLVF